MPDLKPLRDLHGSTADRHQCDGRYAPRVWRAVAYLAQCTRCGLKLRRGVPFDRVLRADFGKVRHANLREGAELGGDDLWGIGQTVL